MGGLTRTHHVPEQIPPLHTPPEQFAPFDLAVHPVAFEDDVHCWHELDGLLAPLE